MWQSDAPALCPVCGKAQRPQYVPFCSKRCADVDLHRWLSGGYAVPAEDAAPPKPAADGSEAK
jgi:hypothetical protein